MTVYAFEYIGESQVAAIGIRRRSAIVHANDQLDSSILGDS
jgi:hypothetical protein